LEHAFQNKNKLNLFETSFLEQNVKKKFTPYVIRHNFTCYLGY